MKTMRALFTRLDFEALPEGFPAQLIGGDLVKDDAPTYGHGRIASRIHTALTDLLPPDVVPVPPVDVLVDEFNVFQPDVIVLRERLPDDTQYVGVPVLVMEILSRSTARRDRTVKRRRLLDLGVGEVWLVDPRKQTIEIHTRQGVRFFAGPEAAASSVVEGFALVPDVLFGA